MVATKIPVPRSYDAEIAALQAQLDNAASSVADLTDVALAPAAVGNVLAVSEIDGDSIPTAWTVADIATQVEMDAHTGAANHPYLGAGGDLLLTTAAAQTKLLSVTSVGGFERFTIDTSDTNDNISTLTKLTLGPHQGSLETVSGNLSIKAGNGYQYDSVLIKSNTSTIAKFGGGGSALIESPDPSYVSIAAKGAASQTANLQEWQDSAGTVLASVDAAGLLSHATHGEVAYLGRSQTWTDAQTWQAGGGNVMSYIADRILLRKPVMPSSNASVGLTVQGLGSQTGNLQEWRDSGGTAKAKIDPSGNISTSGNINAGWINNTGSRIFSWAASPANVANIFRGASGQTADVIQVQDNAGSALTSIAADGTPTIKATNIGYKIDALGVSDYLKVVANGTELLRFGKTGSINSEINVGSGKSLYVRGGLSNTTAPLVVEPYHQTVPGLQVKGAASQTANIQEWQDSADTILASVDAAGLMEATGGYTWGGSARIDGGSPNNFVAVYRNNAANYFSVEDSGGTERLRVDNDGVNVVTGDIVFDGQQEIAFNYGAPSRLVKSTQLSWIEQGSTVLQGNGGSGAIGNGSPAAPRGLYVNTIAAAYPGLIVRGSGAQTANLQEWQDSAGTLLSRVTSDGSFIGELGASITAKSSATNQTGVKIEGGSGSGGGNVAFYTHNSKRALIGSDYTYGMVMEGSSPTSPEDSIVKIITGASARRGLIIQGVSGQTENLQEFQDNAGTPLTKISGDGSVILPFNVALRSEHSGGDPLNRVDIVKRGSGNSLYFGNSVSGDTHYQGGTYLHLATAGVNRVTEYAGTLRPSTGQIGYLGNDSDPWHALWVQPINTTAVGVTVKGKASQTGNLQEWQDSAGAILTSIESDGDLHMKDQGRVHFGSQMFLTNDDSNWLAIYDGGARGNLRVEEIRVMADLNHDGANVGFFGDTPTADHVTRSPTGADLWHGTQAEYDALGTYDADTVYVVVA